MKKISILLLMLSCFSTANATAVFDAAAFGNTIQQVQQGAQELAGQANQLIEMKNQVTNQLQQIQQLQQQLTNLSGVSGIGGIGNINGTISNFAALPQQLNTTANNTANTANQFFTQQQQTTATNIAALQSVFQAGVARNADLQALLNQVEQSPSAKNIADLQARIQAEQIFLQNENNQIAAWGQAQQAQKDQMTQAQIEQHNQELDN